MGRIFSVVTSDYPSMELEMPAVPASIPTSLKLPGALKQQLEEDAKQMGMSLHAFIWLTKAHKTIKYVPTYFEWRP